MRRALYIGRFQIVHWGHLDVIRYILSQDDIDELLLVLGSTQYDHTRKSPVAPWSANPLTAEERKEMLLSALAPGGPLPEPPQKPVSLHEVPDYHDWERWFAHIVLHLPKFAVLYTADRQERDFFAGKGYAVRPFPRLRSFHAGAIRALVAARDEAWRAMVPPTTEAILDRIGAAARLQDLAARDEAADRRTDERG